MSYKKKKNLTFLILSFPSHRDSLSVFCVLKVQPFKKVTLSDGQHLSAEIQYQPKQKIKQGEKQWR